MKGYAPAVAKPIDDCDGGAVVSTGAVTDIDDKSVKVPEVTGNRVQSGGQFSLINAFELEKPEVTESLRPAIVQHPGLGLCRWSKTLGNKRLLSRFEELFDLFFREFLPESGLFLWTEVSFLLMPRCFDCQTDMPVI